MRANVARYESLRTFFDSTCMYKKNIDIGKIIDFVVVKRCIYF